MPQSIRLAPPHGRYDVGAMHVRPPAHLTSSFREFIMTATHRLRLAAVAALMLVSTRAGAQQRSGVMGVLLSHVNDVHAKLVGLARAIPADQYSWRPMEGVRSSGEVLLHVAVDNYFMPSMVGVQPDTSTHVDPKNFATLSAFEKQQLDRDATIATLDRSFEHLVKAMEATPDSSLSHPVTMFGQKTTVEGMWVGTTTHLHEHLGQLIAYARMNHVVPPWSK